MAGGITAYTEQQLAAMLWGNSGWTPPTDYYVGFSTAAFDRAATGAASDEVTDVATGYARVHIDNDAVTFSAPVGSGPTSVSISIDVAFALALIDWGTVLSYYLYDDPAFGMGNALSGGDAVTPYPVTAGTTPVIQASTTNFTVL